MQKNIQSFFDRHHLSSTNGKLSAELTAQQSDSQEQAAERCCHQAPARLVDDADVGVSGQEPELLSRASGLFVQPEQIVAQVAEQQEAP